MDYPKFFATVSLPLILCSAVVGAQTPPAEIEEIKVVGRAQQFYLETATTIGSKVELDAIDLPQSAQTLTEQLIIDLAARDITDLYRSIAGVSEFSYSGVTFRGFRDSGNVFYDGVRGDPYSGFSVPQMFNVARVEVLKGPSAALYGGGEPGGMINYVTKKPDFKRNNELVVTAGNYDLYGGSFESTGALSDAVAYHLGAFVEEQNSFRDNADSFNLEFAGGLLFQVSEDTSVTTNFDYVDQELGGHRLRGAHVDDNGNFLVGRSYNTNETSDFQNLEALVLQANLKHKFSDTFTLNATVRYLDNEREQEYHEPRGWVDANGDGVANVEDRFIRREYRDQYRANEEYSLTLDLVKSFRLGGFEHKFLVGADYHDIDREYDYLRARYAGDGVLDLNIFEPDYGATNPDAYRLTDLNRSGSKADRYGIYLQDYIVFNEQWSLMLGGRYDHFGDRDKATGFDFSDDHLAPRFGLIYKPFEDGSVYLNYSESFKPAGLGSQEDVIEDGKLDPETGVQWELGLKQKFLGGRLLGTVALYQIVKKDLALTNPDDTGPGDGIPALLNLGEVKSEGVELTLVGDLTTDWTMTANYAWNDTRVVEGARIRNTFGSGSKFVNAPEHQLGLWTRYDFKSIGSSIAFGMDYVGEQFSFQGQRVKPYTVFDASWTSSWRRLSLQINVTNLFDKKYAVSGFLERTGHFPGAPREVVAQLRYNF